MIKDLLTIRQVICSGFFWDAGLKNVATALPISGQSSRILNLEVLNILVVVDLIFLLRGGGDTPGLAGEGGRFADILSALTELSAYEPRPPRNEKTAARAGNTLTAALLPV